MNAVQTVLIEIAVILLLSRLLGMLMRLIDQPQVVGEMIAGIALGPSVLGLFHHGAWMNALFPKAQLGNLEVLSQLGVMLFMFLVGLELDPKLLRGQGKAALVTGSVGIIIPFISGMALALGLIRFAEEITGHVPSSLVLCMFMGAAMSITAFPVLARILTERNLHKTKSGTLALTCAAMDDVMGWCILAFVLAVAQMQGFGHPAARGTAVASAAKTVVLAIIYIAVMTLVVRKFLGRLQNHFDQRGYLSQSVMAVIFLILIASSLATDLIGIHQIFGAFLLGAVMPKDGPFIKHLSEKVEDITVLFLLPLFFAYTGLRTELGLLGSTHLWLLCGLIVLVAVAGKFGGVTLAARFYGMSWRRSALLGTLMNTRGLMELIILNIGLSIGVLSKSLFAMMVVMALATTFMTTPFMRLLYSRSRQKEELEDAAREEAEKVTGMNVIVPVSLEASAGALARVGGMLMASDPGRLYAVHLDRPEEVTGTAPTTYSEADRALEKAQNTAHAVGIPVHAISFVSRNFAADITDAAKRYHSSWIVMGWHKAVFFRNIVGGVVGQVLRSAPSHVAILVDKGLGPVRRVMVPYLGNPQDYGALLAAERLSRLPEVTVTLLHVVPPGRENADRHQRLKTLMDKEMPGGVARGTVRLQVVESDAPIEAVVEETQHHDLMILGLSDEWQLNSGAIFPKGESAAQRSACSVLIAHSNPLAPVVKTQAEKMPEKVDRLTAVAAQA